MANDSIITNKGKNTMLSRMYTTNGSLSSTQYLSPTTFSLGINNQTPNIADTSLSLIIPLADGTINDAGAFSLIGGTAGSNTTDNTVTFKEGANLTDNKAQNLIKTNSNVLATWTIADLTSHGSNCDATKYIGSWLYIKDTTTLAKIVSVEQRIGVDSTTNYYSKTWLNVVLSVGWNWLSNGLILSTWTVNGTPGTLNDFQIRITTNNATDTFVAGDVVYDLLRQWVASDTISPFVTGYPSLDFTNNEATMRCYLTSTQANGFNISGLGIYNQDTSPLLIGEDTFTSDSKSSTDEFVWIIKDRIL